MLIRLKEKVATFGWLDAAVFVAAWLLRRASLGTARLVKYYFVAQPVAAEARSIGGSGGSTRFYVTRSCDPLISQATRPLAVLEQRFAQGARCIVAARGDILAGFIWICPRGYREDDVRCVYHWSPENEALWDFDVYLAPEFRMGRLFARLWEHTHAQLRHEGVCWTLSRVDAFNAASLAAHRKLGAITLARGVFVLIARVQLSLLTVAPYLHLCLSDRHAPEVEFDLTSLSGLPEPSSPAG